MNKLIISISIAALSIGFASAQVAGPAGGAPKIGGQGKADRPRVGGAMQKLQEAFKQLDLTTDQKKQLAPLWKKLAADTKAIREDIQAGKLDRKDAAPKLKEVTDAFREELKKVLTEDQQKKLAELMKDAPKPGAKKKPN